MTSTKSVALNRPDSFNLFFNKHVPLIARDLRFEVDERLAYDGSVLIALENGAARSVALEIAHDVESVAVMFSHSYTNVAHEQRMVEVLRDALPGASCTIRPVSAAGPSSRR